MSNISRQPAGSMRAGSPAGGQFAPHVRETARSPWAAPVEAPAPALPPVEVVAFYDEYPKDFLPDAPPEGVSFAEWSEYVSLRKRGG